MTSRNYKRLPIEAFGEHLLLSGDLDPVYIALNRVEWPEEQKKRFLVAYWCCYHVGASCWLSEHEGKDFWTWLMRAAHNDPGRHPAPAGKKGLWPRAPERRHWRGFNAISCVEDLERKYPTGAEGMVDYVAMAHEPRLTQHIPYLIIERRVQEHVGFGPWIAFKVADMLERCLDVPVQFNYDTIMYEDPQEAAIKVWKTSLGYAYNNDSVRPREVSVAVQVVVKYLLDHFGNHDAPPGDGRKVGLQEVETILCKWKSHMNGHYPLDNDLYEIRVGSTPWTEVSPAAKEFLHWMPLPGQVGRG